MGWPHRVARWAAVLSRRVGLDGNPLRRGTDRVEAWIRLTLVVAFLVASPLAAIGVGRWADASMARAARDEARTSHAVTALVLQRVPASNSGFRQHTLVPDIRGRWRAPDGTVRTGSIMAPPGTRYGSKVRIWTDAAGHPTAAPLQPLQITDRVIAIAGLIPAVLALLLAGVFAVVRRFLNRSRLGAWERDWTTVEPLWTRRLR